MDCIPFTQYLRPHGTPQAITIHMKDQELHNKAEALIEAGWCFEAEVLMSGVVSLTCERDTEEGECYIELTANGPPVVDAVRTLVEAAHAALKEE